MNSSWLQKAIRYINKDTSEQNESPKLIVVVRILVLSMLFYIIINSIIYISILNNIGIAILLVSFLVFLGVFFFLTGCVPSASSLRCPCAWQHGFSSISYTSAGM